MSGSGYDPFDVTHTDRPYDEARGGLNPDFARNLLAFGAAAMQGANARTAGGFLANGTGPLGGIGAGIQGAMQQNLAAGRTRSELGLQRAQTQDVMSQVTQRDISNRLALYNLNLQSGVMGGPQFDEQGRPLPAGVQSPYSVDFGQPAQGSGQPASSRGQVAPFIAKNLPAGVSPTEDQMVRTVYGEAGSEPLAGQQAVAQVVQNRVKLSGQSPQDVIFASGQFEPWGNAQTRAKLESLDPSSPQYQSILTNAVRPVMAGAVNDPTRGATHFYSPIAQAQLGRQPPEWAQNVQPSASIGGHQFYRIGYGGGVAARTGGTDIAQAGGATTDTGNPLLGRFPGGVGAPGGGIVPGSAQGAAPSPQINPQMLLRQVITGQRPLTSLSPTEAGAIAPLASRIWPDTGKALTEYSLAGPKAGAEAEGKARVELDTAGPIAGAKAAAEAAGKLPFVGPTAAAEAAAKLPFTSFEARQGAMVWIPGMGWVKNPQYEQMQDEQGHTIAGHVVPGTPGTNEPGHFEPVLGPDGKPLITKLPQNLQAARTKAYEDFAGKDTDSYIAAQNTQSWIKQMGHAAEVMNQGGGFLGTGPTSPSRLAFANNVNDVLRTAGLPNAFDPSKIASWEEFKKATMTAGFELSSHYEGHARQAAQTIMNATSAVPSPTNSPVGASLVSAGIQEAAQNAIDLHEFKQSAYDRSGDLNKAEVDFYKRIPADLYAQRAISTVYPHPVKSNEDLNKYLPGTYLNYNGKIIQVPQRNNAPQIPGYLRQPDAPATQ